MPLCVVALVPFLRHESNGFIIADREWWDNVVSSNLSLFVVSLRRRAQENRVRSLMTRVDGEHFCLLSNSDTFVMLC